MVRGTLHRLHISRGGVRVRLIAGRRTPRRSSRSRHPVPLQLRLRPGGIPAATVVGAALPDPGPPSAYQPDRLVPRAAAGVPCWRGCSVLQVSEEDEAPEPDWAEITRQARYVEQQAPDTLRRLIEAARAAQANLGPTLAASQELARTADAGIREVMEALRGFGGQPALPTGAALLETATPALQDVGAVVDTLTVVRTTGNLALKPLALAGEVQVSPHRSGG
jgi:hypothetical protein